jgi:hypothetical protein
MTRKSYKINIVTNAKNAKAEILDSIYQLPVTLKVKRSKNNLDIKLITDTSTINYTIKSSINPAFLYGNLLWMQVSPAAYLIDLTNPKRFYYGKTVLLDVSDTVRFIRPPISKSFYDFFSKTYPTNKGELYLHVSLPHINSFSLKPENEGHKINTGFWGLSLGIDYCYAQNKFFNLSVLGVSDFFVPVPAAVDIGGEYELMSSRYISFSNNHRINRFTIGYGLSYARNTWDFRYYERFDPPPPTREPIKRSHNSFGLVFPTYFQLSKNFHLGVIYRPTFFVPELTDKFKYEHLMSVDFAWKIRVKK